MDHSFNIEVAKKLGIAPAVILNNLYWWIEKNRANEKHYYDGYYWTYNSRKAYVLQFPYLTERQIEYALRKLIDEGYVITGNYNKASFDRTLWYAITKEGYSILQNCEMETTKIVNANNENVRPIPDINTDINTEKKESKPEESFNDIINSLVEDQVIRDALVDFIKMRKLLKKPLTNRALKNIISKLKKLAGDDSSLALDILDQSITNSWLDVYQLKEDYTRKSTNKYGQQKKATAVSKKWSGETAKDKDGKEIVY